MNNRPSDPEYINDLELLVLYAIAHGDLPVSDGGGDEWYMFSEDFEGDENEPDLWCTSYENGVPKLTEDMRREIHDSI